MPSRRQVNDVVDFPAPAPPTSSTAPAGPATAAACVSCIPRLAAHHDKMSRSGDADCQYAMRRASSNQKRPCDVARSKRLSEAVWTSTALRNRSSQ